MEAEEEELKLPIEVRRRKSLPPADRDVPFPTPPYPQWLYGYDTIDETKPWYAENMKINPT